MMIPDLAQEFVDLAAGVALESLVGLTNGSEENDRYFTQGEVKRNIPEEHSATSEYGTLEIGDVGLLLANYDLDQVATARIGQSVGYRAVLPSQSGPKLM